MDNLVGFLLWLAIPVIGGMAGMWWRKRRDEALWSPSRGEPGRSQR
jgi:uncharacterized iron-regulated membrane protein